MVIASGILGCRIPGLDCTSGLLLALARVEGLAAGRLLLHLCLLAWLWPPLWGCFPTLCTFLPPLAISGFQRLLPCHTLPLTLKRLYLGRREE